MGYKGPKEKERTKGDCLFEFLNFIMKKSKKCSKCEMIIGNEICPIKIKMLSSAKIS